MTQLAPISQQIWDMKYRLKSAGGEAVDRTVEDTWRRIAGSLAAVEQDPTAWEGRFYEALKDFKFLPAGRIVSGAGSKRKVTLFNCFVMGDIPDDMAGIFEQLKEAAVTMQQGGGIGYDFSTLRPKGAPVKGVGADASGPLSFMDVWDAMCRTIMSAGSRRGAMMATMRCDHPDIEAFIEAKREPGRLRMFNLSVLVSDAFMQAVKEDGHWQLQFAGTVYKSLPARDLWDKIMHATYAYAEPGVIFIDRINRLNNLHYCETIHATNPCLTADIWIQTGEGPRQVGELIGKPFTALVDNGAHVSGPGGFFSTGRKQVVKLACAEGHELRLTENHKLRKVTRRTRWSLEWEWAAAGDLSEGDEILLADHRRQASWPGPHNESEGYLLGLLVGDGVLRDDKARLNVWTEAVAANGGNFASGAENIMLLAKEAAMTLPHRSDFTGWIKVQGQNQYRLSLASLRDLAYSLGMSQGHKAITSDIEKCSSDFYKGFLRGLFDTDGSVQGNQEKGVSVRLSQSDLPLLQAAQRMLLRLGVNSVIYQNRREAGMRQMPDGKGGMAPYHCKAQHELVVSGGNLEPYAEMIGFGDTAKASKLKILLSSYKRALNAERFFVTVESRTPDGEEEVFDAQIPGVNAFDANGIVAHNCGEQPLPPYGVCLLGSVNLAKLVEKPFTEDAFIDMSKLDALVRVAVRMMDNVIEVSNYPLPQHAHEASTKRRIGLGVTGLADALILCRARYGAKRSIDLTARWMAAIRRAAYLASTELAAEKGSFPLYDKDKYLAGETVQGLDLDVQEAIATHGIRNALLTSIAPTGTISLFADNVSSGLEPVFSFTYSRNVLMPDGTRREEEVSDYAYRLYRRMVGESMPLPDYFVDAESLAPADHVAMQAVIQKYIDSSISKTINLPEDISFDSFKDVYLQAYDLGCKGCTTYRPNDVTGAVLVKKDGKSKDAQAELPLGKPLNKPADIGSTVVHLTQPLDRPETLKGHTYKVRWPDSDHAMYITINDVIQDGRERPFEVFINSKNMEHFAWTVALTRMISAVFRRGGDISFVVEELKAVFDPRGGQWVGGRYVPSLLAAIGEVIERHLIEIGFMANPADELLYLTEPERKVVNLAKGDDHHPPAANAGSHSMRYCPKCNQPSLIKQEGCDTCTSCGYSKCG